VQVGRFPYSHDVGMTITDEVLRALRAAKPITSDTLRSAEQYLLAPVTNPALGALVYGNNATFACVPGVACTIDRSIAPPYAVGGALGSWVTGFRIGDLVYMSEPGEAFPEVSRAIRQSIHGASAVHVVGMAQDQLGYYFPPEEVPLTAQAMAANGSDHLIYNSSAVLADLDVQHSVTIAQALGFDAAYVHPRPMQRDPKARNKPGVQFFAVAPDFSGLRLTVDTACNPPMNGSALDTHGKRGAISFSWGDGSTSFGGSTTGEGRGQATHTYGRPGTYTITGTVTDAAGDVRSYTQTVHVGGKA
jgi:hypothetical protein